MSLAAMLAVQSAPDTATAIPRTTVHRLTAPSGRAYRLRIYRPSGPEGTRHPLFLVLDGNFYFFTAVETARALAFSGEAPPMIVVGVELDTTEPIQNARIYDFTPPVAASDVPERIRAQGIETGGLPGFARFLTGQLVPFVEREAGAATRCRALFGHSLAALVGLHLLHHRADEFATYVAASPALWWDSRRLSAMLAGDRRSRSAPRPRLLITVGGLEQEITDEMRRTDPARAERLERNRMVDNAVELGRLLSGPDVVADTMTVTFEGETHTSVAPAAISRALRFAGTCRTP